MNASDRQRRFALFSRRVNEATQRQSWRENENTDFPLGSPAWPHYQRVMNSRLLIAAILTALAGVLAYVIPKMIAESQARPLHGNFDIGMRCGGGHEIFLYLDDTGAYWNCPGHNHLRLMGQTRRTEHSVTVLRPKDNGSLLVVKFDDSKHLITWVFNNKTEVLQQVNDPWRTWLPKLLPE